MEHPYLFVYGVVMLLLSVWAVVKARSNQDSWTESSPAAVGIVGAAISIVLCWGKIIADTLETNVAVVMFIGIMLIPIAGLSTFFAYVWIIANSDIIYKDKNQPIAGWITSFGKVRWYAGPAGKFANRIYIVFGLENFSRAYALRHGEAKSGIWQSRATFKCEFRPAAPIGRSDFYSRVQQLTRLIESCLQSLLDRGASDDELGATLRSLTASTHDVQIVFISLKVYTDSRELIASK